MTTSELRGERLSDNPDYVRYWFARLLSVLGSQATYVAFPLMALQTYGDAFAASVVTTCSYASTLVVGLHAGALADRLDRRSLMVAAELVQAAVMAALFAMLLTGTAPLAAVAALAFVNGSMFAAYGAAANAALPDLVGSALFSRALARNQSRDFVLSVAGPALGSLLILQAMWLPFAVNAATFLMSAALTAWIRKLPPGDERAGFGRADLGAGLRLIARDRPLRSATSFLAGQGIVLTGAFFTLVALFESVSGEIGAGLVIAAQAFGGLAGSLVATRLVATMRPSALLVGQGAVWAGGLLLVSVTPEIWVACSAMALMWTLVPATRIVVQSHLTAVTPRHLRGRAQSVVFLVQSVGPPAGPLLAGAVIAATSPTASLAALAGVSTAATVCFVLAPTLIRPLDWQREEDSGDG